MHFKKNGRFFSSFLVILLSFSLVLSPFQQISYAETTEHELDENTSSDIAEDVNENTEEATNDDESNSDLEETTDTNEPSSNEDNEGVDSTNETSEEENYDDDVVRSTDNNSKSVLIEEDSMDVSTSEFDYATFVLAIDDDIVTTSTTATVNWYVNQDVVDTFYIYLNNELVAEVSGDTKSYTFSNLTPGEEYWVTVDAYIDGDFVESDYMDFVAFWSDDELYPVSIITMFNDDPYYNDFIRIRGVDEQNKGFELNEHIYWSDNDLKLPLGKHEVTIYNSDDLSIAATETIEIKAGIDYVNNPLQLQFRLKEMREAAEPFEYEIIEVTEDSFTIAWNTVSKITDFKLEAYKYPYYLELEFNNDKNQHTITGLKPNLTYSIYFNTNYLHDLHTWYGFNVKTYGEDAKAPKVNFSSEIINDLVAEELGIYFRDVTEADMKELVYLHIYNDEEISSLEGLQFAENLTELYALGHNISDISVLQNLTNLYYLDLGYNEIENVDALEKLTELESLDLASNKVKDISKLANLTNLEFLDIQYNDIDDISVLANFKKLITLKAYGNNISDITAIKNLVNLETIELPSNQIENIDALTKLSKLRFLDLSDNEISTIPDLSSLSNLQELYLYENNISEISGVQGLTNLESLALGYNKISRIPDLSSLTNLQELILYNNEIEDISGITGLSNLTAIGLGNNKISNLPDLSSLTNLEELDLYKNEITDISGLKGLNNLRYLDLSENNIEDISVLKELPSLQTVYLYDLEITDIDTIQELRNDGVEVYFDGDLGDWNDWDGDWDDEWVDEEIDVEAVHEAFPEELGFEVSEDGTEIKIDLSNQSTDETFTLTTEQLEVLTNREQKVEFVRGDVVTKIPASAFGNSTEPVEVNVKKLEDEPNSFSSTYDFTITQGTRNISQFKDGITLTFNVNAERAKNPNNLKVHYFNEETGKWELVGGRYSNGTVTVVTYHFSKFTVFEVEEPINDDGNDGNDDDKTQEKPVEEPIDEDEKKDEPKTEDNEKPADEEKDKVDVKDEDKNKVDEKVGVATDSEDNKDSVEAKSDEDKETELPNTATNNFNLLLLGAVIVAAGLVTFFIRTRKAKA